MLFKNRRLIIVPTSCLLAGAMAVSGLEGCASRRQARSAAPVETAAAQPVAPVVQPGQPAPPQAPIGVDPAPLPRELTRPIDQGPNFLPEPMQQDGNLPAPDEEKAGASKSKLGQKFAGMKWGAGARNDKKGKRQASRPSSGSATQDSAEQESLNVRPGDKLAQNSRSVRAREVSLKPGNRAPQPVKLSKPVEVYQYSDEGASSDSNWRLPLHSQPTFRQTSLPSTSRDIPAQNTSSSPYQNASTSQNNLWRTPTQPTYGDEEFAPLPQWPHAAENQPRPVIRPQPQPFQMPRLEKSSVDAYRAEPSRMTNPPSLRQMPVSSTRIKQAPPTGPLSITKMAICREVLSFDEFSEIDISRLQPGQPFLIYASLENFRSVSTLNGFQTLTLSSLEVWTRSGQFVSRQTLGTATDVADAPRGRYYLTHAMKVPENLADGDYVLQLNVTDVNSRETGKSFMAVRITGDRNHLGATGGSGAPAARLASYRK